MVLYAHITRPDMMPSLSYHLNKPCWEWRLTGGYMGIRQFQYSVIETITPWENTR